MNESKTLKIRPDADLRAFVIALIARSDGELFISHEELGEAAIKVGDQQIIAEQQDDGTVYRLAP
jgi:hypothetical protein